MMSDQLQQSNLRPGCDLKEDMEIFEQQENGSCISSLTGSTPLHRRSNNIKDRTSELSFSTTLEHLVLASDSDNMNTAINLKIVSEGGLRGDAGESSGFIPSSDEGELEGRRPSRLVAHDRTSIWLSGINPIVISQKGKASTLQFGRVEQLFGRSAAVTKLQDILAMPWAGGTAEQPSTDQIPPRITTEAAPSCSIVVDDNGQQQKQPNISSSLRPKQVVLIGGDPGSGKSRLALDTSRAACRITGGFFLSGKFSNPSLLVASSLESSSLLNRDQSPLVNKSEQLHSTSRPYSAFGDACSTLIENMLWMILEPATMTNDDDDLFGSEELSWDCPRKNSRYRFSTESIRGVWKKEDLQILIPIIPNIACLWGGQEINSDDYEHHQSMYNHPSWEPPSKQAVHFAFGRFFAILSGLAPVIILLDDLQWSDPTSLELLESILQDESLTSILIVGTIRNDEPTNFANHHTNMETIIAKFSSLQQRASTTTDVLFELHQIFLDNLSESDVAEWLQALLGQPFHHVLPLAECVLVRTGGNALYTKEFLISLTNAGLLSFDYDSLQWRYDVDDIYRETVAAQNVVDVVTKRLESLPPLEQAILPKIACLGSTFSVQMFRIVVVHTLGTSDPPDKDTESNNDVHAAEKILTSLASEGLLTVDSKHRFIKWAHDKIREAALTLISIDEIAFMRFKIGTLLLELHPTTSRFTPSELFIVTNLLNSNAALITGDALRNEVCRLNRWAGETSLQSSAFVCATNYFQHGMNVLPAGKEKWAAGYSTLSLSLYLGAAEAYFCVGDHRIVEELFQEVKTMSDAPFVDKRRIYDAYVNSLSAQGRTVDAAELAISILKILGCRFPRFLKSVHAFAGITRLLRTVNERTAIIAGLPPMHDKEKQWVIHLLFRMIVFSYQTDPLLFPLVLIKGMQYTMMHGIAIDCAPIFATIGLLIGGVCGNFEGGKKYTDLAVMFSTEKTEARTKFITYVFVQHFLEPLESCKAPIVEAYRAGLRSGDLESGFWCIFAYLELQLYTSVPISDLLDDCSMYSSEMNFHNQTKILYFTKMVFQLAFNLANPRTARHVLSGHIMNELDFAAQIKDKPECVQEWAHLHRFKTIAAFWFGEHALVTRIIEDQNYHKYYMESFNPGLPGIYPLYTYCALSCIAMFRKTGIQSHKRRAMKFYKKIKLWVQKGNCNVRHSQFLIEAELASLGTQADAKEQYRIAILIASRWNLTSEQGLAHEKLADYCVRLGDLEDANFHYQRAIELYEVWGALGKTEHLRQTMASLPGINRPFVTVQTPASVISQLTR
jgi:predicted ATPase